jgi:hypothetical protein
MAGSITVTHTRLRGLEKYSVAWVSSAGGAVSGNAVSVAAGELMQVGFIPDAGGTQPTDLYDVVVNDANSLDVLNGAGANLSNSTASVVVPVIGSTTFRRTLEAGSLTPGISNAGASKGGTLVFLIRPL